MAKKISNAKPRSINIRLSEQEHKALESIRELTGKSIARLFIERVILPFAVQPEQENHRRN